MRVPVEFLVVLCLLVGLLPALTVGPLLAVGARDVLGGMLPAYSLAIWHGFNLPLALRAVALICGTLIDVWLQIARRLHQVAEDEGADLIVIGIRRRSAVGKLVLGSNAQDVLLNASCPVLAVKASKEA
jgi:multicomponent K+:H+ antiporter subunit A